MKLWLDDLIVAPPFWGRATNAKRVIQLLQHQGEDPIEEISLTNDLGNPLINGKGIDVLFWLEGAISQGFRPIPKISIRVIRSVDKARMLQALERIDAIRYAETKQATP